MTARSRHIPKDERLACAVGMLLAVPYDDRKRMSAEQLLSLVDWHHNIPFSEGGESIHWNLAPMWRSEHECETRTKTVPIIAKGKRIARVHEDFQRKILSKPCGHKRQRSGRIPGRVNPWGKKGARKFWRGS